MALESNGRIVTFGQAGSALALARLNTDGTIDATFSDNGKVTTEAALPVHNESGVDGVVQADGKLVVVGTNSAGDFTLARFHGDPPDQPAGSKHTGHADHRRSIWADERDFALVQVHGDAGGLDVRVQARRAGRDDGHVHELRVAEGVRRRSRTAGTRSRFARHAPASPTRPRRRGRSPSIRWRRGWSSTLSRQSLRATRGRSCGSTRPSRTRRSCVSSGSLRLRASTSGRASPRRSTRLALAGSPTPGSSRRTRRATSRHSCLPALGG